MTKAGLLLCTWPEGGRPALPFPYADEVWTGIEYQVAAHLIYEGWVDEGLQIVEAVRARHDGVRRNPWNEVECGNHYALQHVQLGAAAGAQRRASRPRRRRRQLLARSRALVARRALRVLVVERPFLGACTAANGMRGRGPGPAPSRCWAARAPRPGPIRPLGKGR